jgi:YidC/Oxa1 family membrane protein insertase
LDRNFLLALALSFAVLTVWTIYTAPPQKPAPATAGAPAATGATGEPAATGAPSAPAPTVEAPRAPAAPAPAPAAPLAPIAQSAADEQRVTVETDRVRAIFTTRGGAIAHWELRDFDDAYQPGRPRV